MPRKRYHHGNLRSALIKIGKGILNDEGIEALTLRRVAREAGVSAAAPYRHFKDKQAVLAAISETGFRELCLSIENANEGKPGDLDAAGRAYLAFSQENPETYRLMFAKQIARDAKSHPDLQESSENIFFGLVDVVETGIQSGRIVPANSERLALSAWALFHGIAMLINDGMIENSLYTQLSPEHLLEHCQSHFRAGWSAL